MIKKLLHSIKDYVLLLDKPPSSKDLYLTEKNKLLLNQPELVILMLKLKDKDVNSWSSKVHVPHQTLPTKTLATKSVNCNYSFKKEMLVLLNLTVLLVNLNVTSKFSTPNLKDPKLKDQTYNKNPTKPYWDSNKTNKFLTLDYKKPLNLSNKEKFKPTN